MTVAYTKAEKESKTMIEEEIKNSGWTSWISSSVSYYTGYGGKESTDDQDLTSSQLNQ